MNEEQCRSVLVELGSAFPKSKPLGTMDDQIGLWMRHFRPIDIEDVGTVDGHGPRRQDLAGAVFGNHRAADDDESCWPTGLRGRKRGKGESNRRDDRVVCAHSVRKLYSVEPCRSTLSTIHWGRMH